MATIKSRVDKKDFDRVLLSETIPSDSPIIFSNSGFYGIVKAAESGELHSSSYVKKATRVSQNVAGVRLDSQSF